MPAKKNTTKKTTAKKATKAAPKVAEAKTADKSCKCGEKCTCANCRVSHSQVPFYILIALLVATMTVLIISLSFNKSVRELLRPATYAYNGMFAAETKEDNKDKNGIKKLSAGAVIDMINNGETGLVIVGEAKCIGCDAFARRVASYTQKLDQVYRYDISEEPGTDDERAKAKLGTDEAPDFVYIQDGVVRDRIDDVKDVDDLAIFLNRYN